MSAPNARTNAIMRATRGRALALVMAALLTNGCASDGGGSVSTSMSVGYSSYYGPGWYGGYYYDAYPPVVVVPPGERPGRPEQLPDRPTTLPADAGGSPGVAPQAKTAPSRPSNVQRPTTRPSPRPSPRPMPRMGRR